MRALLVDNDAVARTDLKMIWQNLVDCEEAGDDESVPGLFRQAIASGAPYRIVALEVTATDAAKSPLLTELRAIEGRHGVAPDQQARILAVTALTGRQIATDLLMQGFDDVVHKPYDAELIRAKLHQLEMTAEDPSSEAGIGEDAIFSTSKILDTISRRLKRNDLELPPAPKIAMRFMQLFTCNADTKEIITLLEQDPTIAAKLIGLSNSAYYRGRTENTTLAQAVQWLGLTRTHDLVMSICCRGYFVTNHPAYRQLVENLWWHALACAHAAEMVIQKNRWPADGDAFTLGLLHDIGKLIIIQVAGDLRQPQKSNKEINFSQLLELMTAHHERLGAGILKKMGYPEAVIALVRHHHRNGHESASYAAQAVHLANQLVKLAGFHLGAAVDSQVSAMLEAQGYTEPMQTQMKEQIVTRMEQLRYVFS